MEVPWNDKTSKALGKLKSETRKVGPHSIYLRPEDRSDFRKILALKEEADIRAIAHDFGIVLDAVSGVHSVSSHHLKNTEKKHEYDEAKSGERSNEINTVGKSAVSLEIEGDPILVAKTVTTNRQYAIFLQSLVDNNIPLVIDGEPLFYHERQHGIQYANGHIYIDKELENHPVNFVNWIGASIYAAWLGGRLPTGKEWECAIVGGEDNIPALLAGANIDQKIGSTTHVETFPPHKNGLHDPIGNVSIWLDEGSSQYERIKAGLEWGHGEERGLYNPRPFWLGNSGLGIRPVFSKNSHALPDTDFYTNLKSFVQMVQSPSSEEQIPNAGIFDAIHHFFSYNEGV